MKTDDTTLILDFYRSDGTDHRGRTLLQIVRKPDRWLEETHDYIQWLFPLHEPSQFNPHAPLLTEEAREAFLNGSQADRMNFQRNFGSAIYRMLVFYGYSFGPLTPDRVEPTGEWRNKADNWLTDGNHNFLRMTRMLRCMTLLGREALARSFHACLTAVARAHPTVISRRTASFWDEAIQSPAQPIS